ncbi:DUF6612 family protein [Clostridium sp. E02]|uniref:DUF6612 family protein n=1 Tax=Clostridium sp. E02 TaxID=2487134 RepID=UPI000F52BD37|nr:DUF6612 family protein [Clostridium sp. E02]
MKKYIMILMAVVTALSVTACKGPKDPKLIYDDALKKTSELSDIEADSLTNLTMSQGEEKSEIKMDLKLKMTDVNSDAMKYLAEGTTSVMGQDLAISMYYENGYYYTDTMGQKIKYAMDIEELMKKVRQSVDGGNMDSSYMSDLSNKKDGDNYVFTYTLDGDKLSTYVNNLISQLGTEVEGISYDIKDASGEATINKEGYFSKQKMKMTMDMTVQGETISMIIDSDINYVNPGQSLEITAPNLDGYTEIDMNAVGQ